MLESTGSASQNTMHWTQNLYGVTVFTQKQNTQITLLEAVPCDASALADLRVIAMKPSLMALGRFNPQRARDRFLKDFVKSDTYKILQQKNTVGFYSLMTKKDHLWLAHFYIHPDNQNNGLGAHVLDRIKLHAEAADLPLRLGALKGSAANQFYIRQGFSLTHSMEYDHYYEWSP